MEKIKQRARHLLYHKDSRQVTVYATAPECKYVEEVSVLIPVTENSLAISILPNQVRDACELLGALI